MAAEKKKKRAKKQKPINKLALLEKLVDLPWEEQGRYSILEKKLLNDLIARYSIEFVNVLTFDQKFPSMKVIMSDGFKPYIEQKWRNFNYKVDHSKYDQYTISEDKCGEDIVVSTRIKTLRNFLN